jgi:predicted aspartyl protease
MNAPQTGLLLMLLGATCHGVTEVEELSLIVEGLKVRDAVAAGQTPPFFRAAVACAFNDRVSCLAETKATLDSNPPAEVAGKVYEMLIDLHFEHGRWAEALAALDSLVALRGESEDPDNMRDMLRVFLRHGPVTVERSAPSSIHVLYKNAHVPFTVNGRPYHGYLDTGANVSMLTESAARQLGLPLESAKFRFGGAAGKEFDLGQIAVAERLVTGNVALRNVPFVIVGDRRQPFVGWGAGKRCILGIQVLLAARTMTWKGSFPGASLELARPTGARVLRDANLCFDGACPVAAAEYQGHRLTMLVDTGAGYSVLRAAFADSFPELMKSGQRKATSLVGIDGASRADAAILPAVTLRIGGRDAGFRRIAVHLKGHGAGRFDGMLGNDLAGKAHECTMDFEAMRITMR